MRLSHVENRIAQQLSLMDIISNVYNNLTQLSLSNITTTIIQTRISALNENWDKISILHEALLVAVASLSADDNTQIQTYPYFHNNLFVETHKRYL